MNGQAHWRKIPEVVVRLDFKVWANNAHKSLWNKENIGKYTKFQTKYVPNNK